MITVKELISKLQNYHPDQEVVMNLLDVEPSAYDRGTQEVLSNLSIDNQLETRKFRGEEKVQITAIHI